MPFAAALSQHPVAADAVGEVLGRIVEIGGVGPDLVVVFASAAHVEFLGEITHAIDIVLSPDTIVGSAAAAVSACGEDADGGPALVVWAAWTEPVIPLRITATPVEEVVGDDIRVGVRFEGLPAEIEFGSTMVLLADPHSFPADALAAHVSDTRPGVVVVGGLVSASNQPRGNALVLGETVHRDGAVAVIVGPRHVVGSVVSQGGRPIGEPMVVTKADRNFILELAGRSALDQFHLAIEALSPDDRRLAARGLLLGTVTDEIRDEFGRGDFLVRPILGADRRAGVLALRDPVPVGRTVQFHLQDAEAADEDLQLLLGEIAGDAALVFSATGRAPRQSGFGPEFPSVAERLGRDAVAGMFGDGELGPVGGRSFLHGYSTAMVVFTDD